jgi:regulator of extracellular matrix RemA (YlzA/DUF370 family)
MSKILILGRGGSIHTERVVAVAHAKSAPILRLVKATHPSRVLNLTYGYPRRAVIILDGGYVVLSSRTPDELAKALGWGEELSDEPQTPWW